MISSVNSILGDIEHELNDATDKKKVSIKRLPKDFSRIKLVENLRRIKEIAIFPDICDEMDPLVKLDSIEYEKVDVWEYDYNSPERKMAEQRNYEALKGAYSKLIRTIKG